MISGTAGAIAGAGAKSLIDGSDFGKNLRTLMPDVIGQTVGAMITGSIAAAAQKAALQDAEKPENIIQYGSAFRVSNGGEALTEDEQAQFAETISKQRAAQARAQALPESEKRTAILAEAQGYARDNDELLMRGLPQEVQDDLRHRGFGHPLESLTSENSGPNGTVGEVPVRGLAWGRVIGPGDRYASLIGGVSKEVDTQIEGYLNDHPGQKAALQLGMIGLTVASGLERFVAGAAWQVGHDGAKQVAIGAYQSAGYEQDRSERAGSGVVLGIDIILGAKAVGGVFKGGVSLASLFGFGKGKYETPAENIFQHWKKQKAEFPEYKNAQQYGEAANKFAESPSKDVLMKQRSNGDVLLYDQKSNTFIVKALNGIKTMFKPKGGMNYWEKQ